MFQVYFSALPEHVRDLIFIEPYSGCWLWLGYIRANGYGEIHLHPGQKIKAHRYVWECFHELPVALDFHHNCRVRCCVNPQHLMPITKSVHAGLERPARMRCKHGHPATPENIIIERLKDGRTCKRCRICKNLQSLRGYYRRLRNLA